jgi:alanine racemase
MTKLIVEKDKFEQNISILKGLTDSTIIAVLKGNGYGLDILKFARFLTEHDISCFAVSELKEAMILRKNGFRNNLLLLTPTNMEEEALMIAANDITPTIDSIHSAVIMNKAAQKLGVLINTHLKIDTGFGRFGFLPEELDSIYELMTLKNLKIIGTYSHLSSSFSKNSKYVLKQFTTFMECVERLNRNGINTGMLHIANSCAFLKYPELHLDAVRIGSAFLGRIAIPNNYGLARIGYLKSNIIEIKYLPNNHNIGYANTFKTKARTRIGIIPVGYNDGYGLEKIRDTFRVLDIIRYLLNDIRQFNKYIYVRIGDRKARILGRINMYSIIVDLNNFDAEIGDEVLLDINPILVNNLIEREYILGTSAGTPLNGTAL